MGAPFRCLDAQGQRLLRLQARYGGLHRDRPSLAWNVRTARDNESIHALPLLDMARARGFAAETCAMDKGYDLTTVYDGCEARDVRPIIPLRATPGVKLGQHKPPTCDHGEWRFAGSDSKRGASKPPSHLPAAQAPAGGTAPTARSDRSGRARGCAREPDRRHADGRGARVARAVRRRGQPQARAAADARTPAAAAQALRWPPPTAGLLCGHAPRRALAPRHDVGLGRRPRLGATSTRRSTAAPSRSPAGRSMSAAAPRKPSPSSTPRWLSARSGRAS